MIKQFYRDTIDSTANHLQMITKMLDGVLLKIVITLQINSITLHVLMCLVFAEIHIASNAGKNSIDPQIVKCLRNGK